MSGVPSNVILPFVGVEFDSSRAQQGPAQMPFSVLLMGQMLAAGSGTKEVLTQVFSTDEVGDLGGIGSQIHCMARRFFANNKITDCYIIMLDDAEGTQATRVLTIASGPATETAELVIYINGTRIAVSVAKDDTVTVIGDAIVTAMADYDYLPWTAANAVGVVTFTARNDGIAAGDNDMRLNDTAGEKTPAGITASFAATTPGTVDPDIQDAIDAIGGQWINVFVNPWDDATNMDALETYLESVFGPLEQKDGLAYQGKRDTVANLATFATDASRNCSHVTLLDCGDRKGATWELAAGVAGAVAMSAQNDPAVPLHRIKLAGFKPNSIGERRLFSERNSLAGNGVATFTDENGVQTEAAVTMYLKNSAGAVDIAYQYQNTLFILMRLRYRFVNHINSKYARAKLVDNTARIRGGQQVISPEIGKAEAVAWFLAEERDGQVEGVDQFIDDVICRRSESNPNRLEWILPPDLVNQFIVGSGVMQFSL